MCVAICVSVKAETSVGTIYVFVKSCGNTDNQISIDGKNLCDLNGEIKKTLDPVGPMIYPYVVSKECYREIVVRGDGKIILSVKAEHMNGCNGNITTLKAEYPLDLEDGETYYLLVTSKGLTDMQIKEPKVKDALKWIDKWQQLPTIYYEK